MLELKSKYFIYYNGSNYGEEYKKNGKLIFSNYDIINVNISEVPAIIDTNISIIEDDTEMVVFQEPIIFDIDEDNSDGYIIYKGKKNNLIFNKVDQEVVNNDINLDWEENSFSEDRYNLLILANALLKIIKLFNEDSYFILNTNLSGLSLTHRPTMILRSLMGLTKNKDLLSVFNKIWYQLPQIIIDNITKDSFIELLIVEKDNQVNMSLSENVIDFLNKNNITNISNSIRQMTEEEWNYIIKVDEITKSEHLDQTPIYYYNKLFSAFDILLKYDYKIKEILDYSIRQKYIYETFYPTFNNLFSMVQSLANFVLKVNTDFNIVYRNKYPEILYKTNHLLNENYKHIIFHNEELMKKAKNIKIDNYDLKLDEKYNNYNIKQLKTLDDILDNIILKYNLKPIMNNFLEENNIFIISNSNIPNSNIIVIIDNEDNVVFKLKYFDIYHEDFDRLYNSI